MTRNEAVTRLSLSIQELAQSLNEHLFAVTGQPVSFVLMMEVGGVAQYVSNTARADGERLITELLERWKANRADIPAHYNPDLKP